MNYKELSFPEYCGKMYGNELGKTLQAENTNDLLLSQSAFQSNAARGKALSFLAEIRVDNFKTLTVLLHREIKHGETYTEEKEMAIKAGAITTEEVEAAEFYAKGFWLP